MRSIFDLLHQTFAAWQADKVPRLGAALAYYTVFSLVPLLVLIVGISSLVFGADASRAELSVRLRDLLGAESARFVGSLMENAHQNASDIVATLIGFVTLLVGALGVFVQLQDALNTIWKVAPLPRRGWVRVVRARVLSALMVMGGGLLLLLSLTLSAALAIANRYFGALLPASPLALEALNALLSFGVTTALFALIFKVLPDMKLSWRHVGVGAAFTALLFTLGKVMIGWYLGSSNVGSVYGAAGSLVALLVWVYYSAQIVLFGAEFTRIFSQHDGAAVQPSPNAKALGEQITGGVTR